MLRPDQTIAYMDRTRDYYKALGFDQPYEWAHYTEVPFARLARPLAETTIALITTAAPVQAEKGDQGPGATYNGAAKFHHVYSLSIDGPVDVRISHIAYDRTHTSAEDPGTWLPLEQLKRAAAAGRIGSIAPRLHGAPTTRSQRLTINEHAPDLLDRLRADGAEAAMLVANCPVCHQTVSLVARHLETRGLPTVVMGCARDIVEYCGVPRFLFSDFPLGNAAGRPHDPASKEQTLNLALEVLASAIAPRTTVQSPLRWSEDPAWKLDYANPDRSAPEQLASLREDHDRQMAAARAGQAEQDIAVARS